MTYATKEDVKTAVLESEGRLEKKIEDSNISLRKEIKQDMKEELGKFAKMVKKGFDDVDKRFQKIDKRFEKLEKEIGGLKVRVSNVQKLLDINAVEHREMRADIKEIKILLNRKVDRDDFMRLEKRVEVLEKSVL